MSRNIRIRTEPNGGDTNVKIQLNQDFDFLEILSLKISQEDVYRSFYSDYGVVVGRVIMNSGVGVPNARVSIFIPLSDEDSSDPEISTLYPYSDLQILNDDGVRYNTLPKDAQGECHAPIGTFPTKRELVDNPKMFEIYEKYYKYTTTTNGAGDFMLFGIPVGNHILNIDVDLSDIGIFSQRPYDFIEQGNPSKLFESPTKFKSGKNLNNLTQVKNRQVGVNVIPFWGEQQNKEVGISRVDVDLNYNIEPKAIFIGSLFGDNEKNSINKNCRPRRNLGRVCEMGEGSGTIQMIRKNRFGEIEEFQIEGGQLINDNGVWAYQIPMNLDYMVTDEFGKLIPTDDPNKGIPTRSRMRFKIFKNDTGGDGRLRTTAKYLVPHNPEVKEQVDYSFDETTSDIHFRDMYWNKIYTVSNHVTRFQRNQNINNRNFIGFKDVDNCVGTKNPLPFNKIDTDFNPIFSIICLILNVILTIISGINSILKLKIPIVNRRICEILNINCISIECNGDGYAPGCSGRCTNGSIVSTNRQETIDCFKIQIAIALNVFEFDFYNDWLNGSLYAFLLKYKKTKRVEKYCGNGEGDGDNQGTNYLVDTNVPNGLADKGVSSAMDEGVITNFKGELFYKPLTNKNQKFYSTELYSLGSVFNCDWQSLPKIQQELIPTTYQLPPLVDNNDDGVDVTGISPLLFDLNCFNVDIDYGQSDNIRRICEIGVGLDEDETQDGFINSDDIDNDLIRRRLIQLNVPEYLNFNISEINQSFEGDEYKNYRNVKNVDGISQFTRSFYFYFGTIPNSSAIDLMNSKYFTQCGRVNKSIIQITGIVSDVTTVNGSDGLVSITVNGGSPDYTYEWYSLNDDSQILSETEYLGFPNPLGVLQSPITQGTYYVIVTDSNGVSARKTFVVNGLQELSANITTKNTRSQGESTGIIYINSITGGVGPYDINITGQQSTTFDDIAFSVNYENLPQGNYTVSITDSNVPSQTITEDVTIGVPTLLDVSVFPSNPNCVDFQDGEVEIVIQGGTPPYSYTLTNVTDDLSFGNINGSFMNFDNGEIGGTVIFEDLTEGIYELKVIDSYDQQFPSGDNNVETITLTDITQPIITRISATGITAQNLVIGTTYELFNSQDDENPVGLGFIATDSTQLILDAAPINGFEYQLISEFGCASDLIE